MGTFFEENFNYPDGDLNGNDGWSAPSNFYINSNQLFIDGKVTKTARKSLSGENIPIIINFSCYVCMSYSYGNMHIALETGSGLKCGIGLSVGGAPKQKMYLRNNYGRIAVSNIGVMNPGIFYPISYSFNTATKTYSDVFFNNIHYGGTYYAGESRSDAFSNLAILWNETNTVSYGAWDSILIDDGIKDNLFFKYPRWQPTKYGMRPFY